MTEFTDGFVKASLQRARDNAAELDGTDAVAAERLRILCDWVETLRARVSELEAERIEVARALGATVQIEGQNEVAMPHSEVVGVAKGLVHDYEMYGRERVDLAMDLSVIGSLLGCCDPKGGESELEAAGNIPSVEAVTEAARLAGPLLKARARFNAIPVQELVDHGPPGDHHTDECDVCGAVLDFCFASQGAAEVKP